MQALIRSVLTTLFVGLALAVLSARAFGQTQQVAPTPFLNDEAVRQGVRELVSLRHPPDGDKDRNAWLKLGPGAPRVIVAMLRAPDRDERVYSRVRMIEGLQYFDDPEARAAVRSLLADSDEPILKQAALGTLGRWGRGEDAERIGDFVDDANLGTRQAAREALGRVAARTGDADLVKRAEALKGALPPTNAVAVNATSRAQRGPIAVSSSDQVASEEFLGEWRGLWIEPISGIDRAAHESGGLGARPVQLTVTRGAARGGAISRVLRAEAILERPRTRVEVSGLQAVPGHGQRVVGVLAGTGAGERIEAELLRQGGGEKPEFVLRLRTLGPNPVSAVLRRR